MEGAYELARRERDSRATGAYFSLALSGGSTPRALYQVLAQEPLRADIDWSRIRLFLGDERPVPPSDPASNWGLAEKELLHAVPLRSDLCHRPEGERPDLDAAAEEYARLMSELLPADAAGVPVLDMVFLGVGVDGHTASLFPGSPALSVRDRWFVANPVQALGSTRLTVTLPVLRAARELVFLVAGAAKARVLAEILSGDDCPLPAARIGREPNALWLLDEAAASELLRRAPHAVEVR
jgi:6-phosphogluconolactonase